MFAHKGTGHRLLWSSVLCALLWLCAPISSGQAVDCENGKIDCNGTCISMNDICLLEPLPGGAKTITSSETGDLGALLKYFNGGLWEWALRIGVAIAVLQGAVAGLQMVSQGPDKVAEAKQRFTWAVIGLLMLLMAGAILQFINPVAFSQ